MNKPPIVCMGYPLYSGSLTDVPLNKKIIINTINQYSYCVAEKDSEFKTALMNSDMLLPDGIGIVLASRVLNHKRIKKIAGDDLHQYLLTKLNQEGGTCFYLGSSNRTLMQIKQRLAIEFPNIRMQFYSPPYKVDFSKEDNEKMIAAVNQCRPDILFIGMTAPKQEKWLNTHKLSLNVPVIASIGAAFDFYAGTIKRPGYIWRALELEWLGRLLSEPRRMWKRYLFYGPMYLLAILQHKTKQIYNMSYTWVLQTKII